MKTYNSYEHARIENPEGDIAVNAEGNLFVHTDDLKLSDAFAFEVCIHDDYCNPKQGEVWRCILLPRQYVVYLYKSHEGWDTDWVEGTLLDGQAIKPVQKLYTQLDVGHHILRAAALENQMNIDNLATQTPEEKEALDSIAWSRTCELSKSREREFLDLIDTTPHQHEMSKFSGKAEWKNGDDVEAYGKPYKYVGLDPFNDNLCICLANQDDDPQCFSVDEIKKPETEAERVERERLEAAYCLYVIAQESLDVIGYESFQQFTDDKVQVKFWLAIVDKTNYRKESN